MAKDKGPTPATEPARPRLRAKLWVDVAGKPGLTEAGADLLTQIDACGSLSEAARRLRFAYRRAWLLVDAMNATWPEPLVSTAVGGKKGGGTKLTDRGRDVLAAYRDLQLQVEHLLDLAGDPFEFTP